MKLADFYTIVQGYLNEVGINSTLEPLDNAAYNKLMAAGWNNHLLKYRFS
jgi:hypothetical protein